MLAPAYLQRLERALPILRLAEQTEQRLDRPRKTRIEPQRPLGELASGLALILAHGFQKKTPQTELLGIGRSQHGLENAPRRCSIAIELRRLRSQQMRERLVRQRLAGLQRKPACKSAVARADG